MEATLSISSLIIGFHNRNRQPIPIAGPLDIEAHSGEFICLIGPNGSGKSTLMRTISKVQNKLEGRIMILNHNIDAIRRKDLAKQLSVVLTDPVPHINLDVQTLIALGRYPYTGWFGTMTRKDREVVTWSIESTGMGALAARKLHELSDGELQKAMIARALCQDTPLMLLDEPTAHLDVANRIEIIRLLRDLTRQTGKTIILTTHELDLALKAADKIWVLSKDHTFQQGTPEDLALDSIVDDLFGKEGLTFDLRSGTFTLHEARNEKISIEGDEITAFWTQRALERIGYTVAKGKILEHHITIQSAGHNRTWTFSGIDHKQSFESIASLLLYIKKYFRR
jgi:iron complex transport system ATP-binding protein